MCRYTYSVSFYIFPKEVAWDVTDYCYSNLSLLELLTQRA